MDRIRKFIRAAAGAADDDMKASPSFFSSVPQGVRHNGLMRTSFWRVSCIGYGYSSFDGYVVVNLTMFKKGAINEEVND